MVVSASVITFRQQKIPTELFGIFKTLTFNPSPEERGILTLRHCLDALGADFHFLPADFFNLKIKIKFPARRDVGMRPLIARSGTAAANFTNFTHKVN